MKIEVRTNVIFFLLFGITLTNCTELPRSVEDEVALEIVLEGGRVMDPETGLDAIRNVGLAGGKIVAISEDPIEGKQSIDVTGLVVAPGFIDLHAHGQDPVSRKLQLADGVTTALEMELGVFPIDSWLEKQKGKAVINYGATVGHLAARMKLFHNAEIESWATLSPDRTELIEHRDYAFKSTTDIEQVDLLKLMEKGLDDGGLGFGLGITYTPGATRAEIFEIFQLANERTVPLYVHVRGRNSGGRLGSFQECIANAASTGASLHFVHLNSSSGEMAPLVLDMIRGAVQKGVDVTTEAYPYTAGSTRIESASYDEWESWSDERFERLQWPVTGERLTRKSFERYRQEGGWLIQHGGRSEETNAWIVAQKDVMVASDGIPFLYGPAHPRGAGTFSRILGHYVREEKKLELMDALRKMTLLPAKRVEKTSAQMKFKGRIQVGADADITVFDPNTVMDRSTFERGDVPSKGIAHVFVSGSHVLVGGTVVEDLFPGQAIIGSH